MNGKIQNCAINFQYNGLMVPFYPTIEIISKINSRKFKFCLIDLIFY